MAGDGGKLTIQNIPLPDQGEIDTATCVAIDFETANSGRASACSIGVTWFDDIRVLRTAHRLIRPIDLDFNGFNIAIHGIYPEDVEDEPEFPSLWQELLPLMRGKMILAHNAAFDMSVLRASLDLYGLPWPEVSYLCTVKIAQLIWPDLPNHKLPTICRHIGFDLDHHSAASDAEGCAMIALSAARHRGIPRIEELPDCCEISMGRIRSGSYSPCSSARRND